MFRLIYDYSHMKKIYLNKIEINVFVLSMHSIILSGFKFAYFEFFRWKQQYIHSV